MFAESVAGYIPADVKIPVIVWYNPAGIHSSGRFFFYEDIYEKFHWMKFAFVSHVAFVKLTIIIINIEQGH